MVDRSKEKSVQIIIIFFIAANLLISIGLFLLTMLRSHVTKNYAQHVSLYDVVYKTCVWIWFDAGVWIGRYLLIGVFLSVIFSFFAKTGKLLKLLLISSFVICLIIFQLCLPVLSPF